MNKNKIFKLYTADYSKDGYDYGINDAKKHLQKNKFKFFKAIHPINYIWNFDNAFESFHKNYETGYLDGQRVDHGVYNTNQTKGANMALVEDSYENHLRMVGEVKREIATLKSYLAEIEIKYKGQIDTSSTMGFLTNYTNPLYEKYQRFSQKLNDLTNMIERHEAELSNHEAFLERKIQEARY